MNEMAMKFKPPPPLRNDRRIIASSFANTITHFWRQPWLLAFPLMIGQNLFSPIVFLVPILF